MSAHQLPTSVDLEPAVITMEDSMNVTVQVEQWPQDPILITVSRVLVGGVCSTVVLHVYSYLLFLLSDINECTSTPNICGLGTCSNIIGGGFYECTCQNGAMLTGTNSDGTLTCSGKYTLSML